MSGEPTLRTDFTPGAVVDPVPAQVDRLLTRASRLREEAATLAGIADRAEAQVRRLAAYRYATDMFAGDPQGLDLVARLAEDWTGDGPQLVAVVREVRRLTSRA